MAGERSNGMTGHGNTLVIGQEVDYETLLNQGPYTKEERIVIHRYRQKQAAKHEDVERYVGDEPWEAFREWAESTLIVPTGPLAGKYFRIPDWQHAFIKDAFETDTIEAGLCVARKNGKSGLIAALALCHLCGPLNSRMWRGITVSIKSRVAQELRDAIEHTAIASGLLGKITIRRAPMPGYIMGLAGSRIDFLSADKHSGQAVGADLAIVDEAGLLEERNRQLWNSVFSCISGREGKFMAISIRGDGPMFNEMEERSKIDPEVIFHDYSTALDAKLNDEEAWHQANPGLRDGIKSIKYMKRAAKRAIDSPANESDFRAFDMNQQLTPGREMIISKAEWDACEVAKLPPAIGAIVLAIDLGTNKSMSAIAAHWPMTHRHEVFAAFPSEPDLLERGAADGVGRRYVRMLEEGSLRIYPGRVTPVKEFLLWFIQDYLPAVTKPPTKIIAIGYDSHRKAEALQAFSEANLVYTPFGRGSAGGSSADGTHDLNSWQKMVMSRTLLHKSSLLMDSAIMSSSVKMDSKGYKHLDKKFNRNRIDALSASVIAAGITGLITTGRVPGAVVVDSEA